jgi:hypothetical protein
MSPHLQGLSEDGSAFIQNVHKHHQDYKTSQPVDNSAQYYFYHCIFQIAFVYAK